MIKISAIIRFNKLREEREEVIETQLHKNQVILANTIKIKRLKRGTKKVILEVSTKNK